MIVIVGAGPAGLYTAIKLRQNGVKDILVVDPREGEYTRPGNLEGRVFIKAEEGIGKKLWPFKLLQSDHIKELERGLYREAITLGIRFEKQAFVSLQQGSVPGVILADNSIIPADYVFDCTGSQRKVVNAANQIIPTTPFKTIKLTDISLPHYLLAYVKLDHKYLNFIEDADLRVKKMLPIKYAQLMLKLRSMGWKDSKPPRCYAFPFSADKSCLYLQIPSALVAKTQSKQQAEWLTTFLASIDPRITYTPVHDSKKYTAKPTFTPFSVTATRLEKASHQEKGLPTIIPLGDAQIDANFSLGHGISNGMDRIDSLFKMLGIADGTIIYFDADGYQKEITLDLMQHTQSILAAEEKQRTLSNKALALAEIKLEQALSAATGDERAEIADLLLEMKARNSHFIAMQLFAECHSPSSQVIITQGGMDDLQLKLSEIISHAENAILNLPPDYIQERQTLTDLLFTTAESCKLVGNELFKKQRFPEAMASYRKSLDIYLRPAVRSHAQTHILPLFSNLIISLLKLKLYSEAIATAQIALPFIDKKTPHPIHEKILYNLIKATIGHTEALLAAQAYEQAQTMRHQALSLMSEHLPVFKTQDAQNLKKDMDELQRRLLASSPSPTYLKTFGIFAVDDSLPKPDDSAAAAPDAPTPTISTQIKKP